MMEMLARMIAQQELPIEQYICHSNMLIYPNMLTYQNILIYRKAYLSESTVSLK